MSAAAAAQQEQDIQRKLSYSAALPVSKPGDKTSRVTEAVSSFHFSQVFRPETTQRDLFEQTTYAIIEEALEGKNGLVFAYGVTNSGKTYTILGTPEQPGILPETFVTLFKKADNFRITASYVEIYNEKVYDLLATGQRRVFLQLLEKDGRVYVKDLEERPIKSYEEAKLMLETGQKNRQVGETKCNSDSSRSHCVFSLHLYHQDDPTTLFSKISIVDLAGCERGAKTGASGLRLQEASKINGSLMNLNRCLETLRFNQLHPKPVQVKMEYGTDGHKKRKRPSLLVSKDGATNVVVPAKADGLATIKERPSIRSRNSIQRVPSTRESSGKPLDKSTTTTAGHHPLHGRAKAPGAKKRFTEHDVALLRDELDQLKDDLQAKDADYVQQEMQLRRDLVHELNKQLDSMKASYEVKLADVRAELDAANAATLKLTQEKSQLESLCEKLQEQIDECEDEIRRIEARHADELLDLQTF
ncbi:hypothetical protein DYB30_005423 [Aphanomyces astaci]|uniref:Kinesin motor domain-containing protein n=2 Tax=Aphanomyces astaci TaxID=112090 RepID=A0A397DRH5_APHAT|nr:hypothetical protein DYB30_005423 [Aphanomyces astaci]